MQKQERKYWNRWYAAVFIFLVLQIVLYYLVTQYFQHP